MTSTPSCGAGQGDPELRPARRPCGPPSSTPARRGTILIIVAGLSALLASLALAFLVHMRSDVEEATGVVNEVQAHLMLLAGCNFIQEASRLGYDSNPPQVSAAGAASPYVHDEGY